MHWKAGFKAYLWLLLAPWLWASHPLYPFFSLTNWDMHPPLTRRTVVGIRNGILLDVGTVLTLTLLSSLQQAKELINK